jgi:thymidine phosphorylase
LAAVGDQVDGSRPLAIVHARSDEAAALAAERLRRAYRIGEGEVRAGPVILERLGIPA